MTRKILKKTRVIGKPPYQINISFDPRDKVYVARVPELENCHTHGDSPEEALRNAQEAIELWIETARELRIAIPEPTALREFSGKFVLRTSPELHAKLAATALGQGKSMNEFVVDVLEEKIKKAG